MDHPASSRWPRAIVALCVLGLIAACTPDPDESAPAPTDPADQPTTTEGNVAGISDDCPPISGVDIPSTWPGQRPEVVVGGESVTIDGSEAIPADCLMLAGTYSSAMDIPIPELLTLGEADGTLIRLDPPQPATTMDDPDQPWWGEDRLRVCVNLGQGRPGCTNVDIRVLREDVAELSDRFGVTTLPTLMSPLTRSNMRDEGVTNGGIARLQDAYAAQWALQLVARTIELPQPPLDLQAACEATGNDPDDLWTQGRQLLENFASVADLGGVELTTTMGQEPPAELSATANEALRSVNAWLDCAI